MSSASGFTLAALSIFLVGCGGSPSGGNSGVVPSVSRKATGPSSDAGTPATGFDAAGKPVFVAVQGDPTKWKVFADSGTLLYEIPVAGASDSRPGAVSGKYVVGGATSLGAGGGADKYSVLVASRGGDGTVATAVYADRSLYVCDGGKALVYDSTVDGDSPPSYLLDLASGSQQPVALPSGAVPYAMKGRYVLCSVGGSRGRSVPSKRSKSRSPGGMLLFDLSSGTSVNLQAPEDSDGAVYAYVLNSKGQTLGVTYQGERTDLRLWDKSGVPGAPLDSVTSGYLEPGWLSEDARRLSYDKVEGGVAKAYMQVGGQVYLLSDGTFALASLYGLNAKGTLGFGYDPDLGSEVSVAVSYR